MTAMVMIGSFGISDSKYGTMKGSPLFIIIETKQTPSLADNNQFGISITVTFSAIFVLNRDYLVASAGGNLRTPRKPLPLQKSLVSPGA